MVIALNVQAVGISTRSFVEICRSGRRSRCAVESRFVLHVFAHEGALQSALQLSHQDLAMPAGLTCH